MRCPNCKQKLLHKSGEQTLLRSHGPLVFGADGGCRTRCYYCKADIGVPVAIEKAESSAQAQPQVFVMRRRK